jgi:hypothetical protein
VICVLTFSKAAGAGAGAGAGAAAAQGDAVFVVCDFAGVENTFMCEDPRVRETIGVKALVDPMVDKVLQKVKADIRKNVREVIDQDFVLTEKASSYLFDSQRSVMDVFLTIEKHCADMYRLMNPVYQSKRVPSLPSTVTSSESITFDVYGSLGLSQEIIKYRIYADSYLRMRDLYLLHMPISNDRSMMSIKDTREISFFQLTKLLVWYTRSRIRFQALFQSLVTREYDPKADTIKSKTQIEAYSKQALCDQRVKEGVFINDSLRRLRSFISTSVSATSRTPPFLDECVPLQCHPHHLHCFGQSARKEDGGPLTRLIEKSVAGKTNTFCIFTVVNLSRNANNPPPIPYVDIGSLLRVREALYPLLPGRDDSPKIQEIEAALRDVREQMRRVGLQGTLLEEFEALQSLIQRGSDVPHHLEELIQKFISHNAITTIGTIEFTDAMAKYGATQITCAPSFVKAQVKQIEQRGVPPVSTTARRRGVINNKTQFSSISLNNNTNGGRMPTRVRRKANRRTRKKRNAT